MVGLAWGGKATFGWFFHFQEALLTRMIVHIDGHNLQDTQLQGTPFKSLDVVALLRD